MKLWARSDILERRTLVGSADDLHDLENGIEAPTSHFVLFVAADTSGYDGPTLVAHAEGLIRAGASYVCCWGADCSRFHDAFDEADLAVNGDVSDSRFIFTTWHEEEPLEEAAWFALNSAIPAPAYAPTTGTVILVAIGNDIWATRLDTYVSSGASMLDEA